MTDLAPSPPDASPTATLHRFRSGIGDAVNGYLIELEDAVIAVDSCLGRKAGTELRATLDALGKPLAAVLVTHGHFDHVSGLAQLTEGTGARIVTTPAVAGRMKIDYATAFGRFGAQLGEDWQPVLPEADLLLGDGESVELGGTRVRVLDLGLGGDSEAGAAFSVEALGHRLFVGDLVYHDVHPLQLDGGVLAWLANLERIRRRLPEDTELVMGHGEPGGLELMDRQRDYLIEYASHALELCDADGTLTEEARAELVRRVTSTRPGWGLELFVAMSAQAVAQELTAPSRGA